MATTRIISMHVTNGGTVAGCLSDRTAYSMNPEKTNGGELISSFACTPETADAEFLLSKRQYATLTGRTQESDVIAYQIRQSFKPGEVTPEKANKLGYELAERFLKGKHAFIVATHCDRAHTHNHIIFNSTSLDCKRKFHDFLGSGKAVARLSDMICLEHNLSVIEHPRLGNNSYNKWLGSNAKPSHRELLRTAIDGALEKKPSDIDALLTLLRDAGYEIKRGKNISFKAQGEERFIRLSSLGEGYSDAELRAVISGEKQHTPKKSHKKRDITAPKKTSLLIDIQAKLDAGMGGGFRQWATVQNLKQMAQTVMYLQQHDLADYAELVKKTGDAMAKYNALSAKIKAAETRMSEIAVLKTHIINYSKTRDIYAGYKAAGYSKKYLSEHEGDIILHKAAKKAFDELGMKKLPTVKTLQEEYSRLLAEKKADYAEYRTSRGEMRELLIHKQNIDRILGIEAQERDKEKEQERR